MKRSRLAFGFAAMLAMLAPASLVWACVAPVSLTTVSPTVQPGGTIRVIGREMAPGAPVEIRLNSVGGPLLTTVTGQAGGMNAKWEHDVPIPADLAYGKHVLYGVQNYRNMNAVIPKATFYVGTVPDAAPEPEVRAGSLDVGSGPSAMNLVLLGLGAAAGGLLLVGGLTMLAGSKRNEPQAQPVKSA